MNSTEGYVGAGLSTGFWLFFGPLLGEYATILFGALVGGLWAVQAAELTSRLKGFLLLAKLMLTALLVTGPVAAYLQSKYQIPAQILLAPVAGVIASVGEGWLSVGKSIKRLLLSRLSKETQ